ncbi:MAG: glycosyltransferase family 9 protein [Proteobacteria bacterium]|nr:glycosyltransferase family 9 protein [Pseudomonadota bacterium]
MRVDTMRQLDYWFGIPLTFIASLYVTFQDWFRNQASIEQPEIKRILFVELSEMGSTIIADPAMRRAQKNLNAELFFVIFAKNRPSLELLDTVKRANVFTLREDSLLTLLWDSLRYLVWCRKNHIDTVIDLELFSRVSALLTGLSGAWRRVGFHSFHNEGLWRGFMLTHKVAYNAHQHVAKSFIALVYSLECNQTEIPYAKTYISDEDIKLTQAVVSEQAKAEMRQRIALLCPEQTLHNKRIVLINPNASELLTQRRWPKERYAELMRNLLSAHHDIIILITGAPAEREEAEALKQQCDSDRVINFAGGVKFSELPTLYWVSHLMVSNDSGPGHFSAITPLKTFVLFGPETPKLYGSLGNSTPIWAGLACAPCVSAANHRKTPCSQPVCMTAISVEQVQALVSAELNQNQTTST